MSKHIAKQTIYLLSAQHTAIDYDIHNYPIVTLITLPYKQAVPELAEYIATEYFSEIIGAVMQHTDDIEISDFASDDETIEEALDKGISAACKWHTKIDTAVNKVLNTAIQSVESNTDTNKAGLLASSSLGNMTLLLHQFDILKEA